MGQNISLYKSLQEISAVRFHEIKFTGNVKLVNKDHKEGFEYQNDQLLKLNLGWIALYDEYFERTDDIRFKKELKNKDATLGLLLKINTIDRLLKLLEYNELNIDYMPSEVYLKNKVHFGNELKRIDKKIQFESEKELKPQIERTKSILGGFQTRYEILFKEDLVVTKRDIEQYYEIKAQIAEILQLNDIPDHINMLQWIVHEKRAKKRARNEQHNSRKRRGSRNNPSMGKAKR